MKLIIVESPSKAKTIGKYLGSDYKVMASAGHIRDLPEKRMGIDVDHDFAIEYVVNPDKKDIINKLKQEVKKSDEVLLATDPDREGEAISWHLKEVLGIKADNIRIEFNEITKNAVNKAIESPRNINKRLVDAQQARRVVDRLVGYKLSPVLSQKIKNGLSGGRVQSVALQMVLDRENEIKNFVVEEYWNIFAILNKLNNKEKTFKSQLNDINGKKAKIDNKDSADEVISELKESTYTVDKVKKSITKSNPQPPFTTSTLQQDGSNKLNMPATMVMQIAQQLYEGVDIPGEGHTALVTYIRTDSVRVSSDAQLAAKDYIIQNYGKEYVPNKFNVYKVKGNAQDAHEAIRPISLAITPESLKGKINNNQYRLYRLIYSRFLASQFCSAEYDSLTVDITAKSNKNKYGFKIKGKSLRFDGYLKVYKNDTQEDESENAKLLPQFTEGETLSLVEIKGEQKFTTPPPRYTDATLIKAMEENGIGRPSTYATILSVIIKREYVVKEEKALKPTQLGEVVGEILRRYFPSIMDVKFTANMESDRDAVETEGLRWQDIIHKFYPRFNRAVLYAKNDNRKERLDDEVSTTKCEKCGAMMIVKSGKFGKFLACPNYPECKNTKPYGDSVGKCPKCGGDIYKRKSKAGKIYYTCSNSPKCDLISWDLPAPYLCPECKSIMKTYFKDGNKQYLCVNPTCKHKEEIKSSENEEN